MHYTVSHTPGPWSVSKTHPQNACAYVHATEGREVAVLYAGDDDAAKDTNGIWGAMPVRDANARLVAAAPDMIRALKRAAYVLAEIEASNDPRVLEIRGLVVAAIRKATPEYYGEVAA